MGLFMTVTYLAGFHQPEPHHVPVAVVDQTPEATQAADQIQTALGDRVDVKVYPSETLAEDAIKRMEVAGAYVPGESGGELLTAPAYSETLNGVVVRIFSAVSEKANVPMTTREVVSLDEHDSAGQNSFFFLVVLSVSAYSLGIAIAVAGNSYSYRRRLALMVPLGLLLATVDFLFARFVMQMFQGHEWAIWLVAAIYVQIVLSVTIGLHPLVRRWSTLTFSAIFVALNFTSSGGVFEPVLQPAFFGWLHNFWVGSGFIQTIRQIQYFPDAGSGPGFGILAGWMILAVVVLLLGAAWEKTHALKRQLLSYRAAMLEEDVAV